MTDINQLMDRAIAAHQAGRLADAEGIYRAALAVQPNNRFATHNLGMVRIGQGALAEGLSLVSPVIAADPDNPSLAGSHREIGLALFNAGHWEEARVWLGRARSWFPSDTSVAAAWARARPRDYLEPEILDPRSGELLRRGAPRESGTYVYSVDVVGTCNLRCPTCPVGHWRDAERPRGFMEPETFEAILDKIVRESPTPDPEVFLFSWGEPLLHPRLPRLVRAVNERGLTAHLSSNLNVKRGVEEVISSRPASLKISLSGFTQGTYGRTHAGGRLELVLANMRRIREALDESGSTTRVWVGHHLYRSNLGELDQVRDLCAELGFAHQPIPAFYQPLERLVDLAQAPSEPTPILDDLLEHPSSYLARFGAIRRRDYDCELRSNQTAINFDGSVALCCSVYDAPNMLGVSFLDTPREEIEGLKYRHPFCGTCMDLGLHYAPVRISV